MRICVVGAGSIGGVIAARLAAVADADVDVSVLARGVTLSAIRDGGLRVSSPVPMDSELMDTGGTVTVRVTASEDAAELGTQDFVIVAVKAQSMAGVAASVGPLLGRDTAVLSTLNGVPWWFLDGFGGPASGRHLNSVDPGGHIASVLPASRVIGGTVHLSASSPAPGEVSWRSGNGLIIGELDGAPSPRLDALASALRAAGFVPAGPARGHEEAR
jgi:2-dehydropantoate 2-reductase